MSCVVCNKYEIGTEETDGQVMGVGYTVHEPPHSWQLATTRRLKANSFLLVCHQVRTVSYHTVTLPMFFSPFIKEESCQLRYLIALLCFYRYTISQSSCLTKQESPAIADKLARRESLPKIAPIRRAYNVVLAVRCVLC